MTRKGGARSSRRTAEILALEGASEKIYLDRLVRLGDTDLVVRTIDCHGGDLRNLRRICGTILDERERGLRSEDFVGVVMDVDNTPKEEILGFIRWCRDRGIEVYLSNPSFEVFLLMHFSVVPGSLSQDGLEDSLSRHLGRRYDKARGIAISEDSVAAALRRADRALPDGSEEGCLERPGTTTVHRLVRKIASRFQR